ncbi:hypothetical protein ABKN59_001746 [Abortiporus biennis]
MEALQTTNEPRQRPRKRITRRGMSFGFPLDDEKVVRLGERLFPWSPDVSPEEYDEADPERFKEALLYIAELSGDCIGQRGCPNEVYARDGKSCIVLFAFKFQLGPDDVATLKSALAEEGVDLIDGEPGWYHLYGYSGF